MKILWLTGITIFFNFCSCWQRITCQAGLKSLIFLKPSGVKTWLVDEDLGVWLSELIFYVYSDG